MSRTPPDNAALEALLSRPEVAALSGCLGGRAAWVVGGAVRDAVAGRDPGPDLDVAIDGPIEPVLECLAGTARTHERFGTATAEIAGGRIDLARTRTESYPLPGSLPEVAPAPIEQDLERRDFTVNAIALRIDGQARGELVDPFGGVADLRERRLRVLHPRSFADDPTRALRAARYAARLDLTPDQETERLLAAADLGTVSRDRVLSELRLAAAEADPAAVGRLLARWSLLPIDEDRIELVERAAALARQPVWASLIGDVEGLVAGLLSGEPLEGRAAEALAAEPASGYESRELGDRLGPAACLIAKAAGRSWPDRWLGLREIELQIGGDDLIAAGVEAGPAIGRGLRAALRARIEGRIEPGRDAELKAALEGAGE